jgi:hypothetical protein
MTAVATPEKAEKGKKKKPLLTPDRFKTSLQRVECISCGRFVSLALHDGSTAEVKNRARLLDLLAAHTCFENDKGK